MFVNNVDTDTLNLIHSYTNAMEAMEGLKSEHIDLIFLDIHLPKLSGIDFLKTLVNPPQIILTTAFSDYALESYDLNVVDYLLKPFSFQRFVKAISKVMAKQKINHLNQDAGENNQTEDVYIKSGYDHIRINLKDIIFIRSDADYTELHLKNKKHLSSESLRYWEAFLPQPKFIRVHKSYIINTKKIIKVSGNQIYFENDIRTPLGRAFKNEFMERFLQ
ncbi:LytR/AlgR family response regulator transcription factor [Winogradskyella sp. PC D3.3]